MSSQKELLTDVYMTAQIVVLSAQPHIILQDISGVRLLILLLDRLMYPVLGPLDVLSSSGLTLCAFGDPLYRDEIYLGRLRSISHHLLAISVSGANRTADEVRRLETINQLPARLRSKLNCRLL